MSTNVNEFNENVPIKLTSEAGGTTPAVAGS